MGSGAGALRRAADDGDAKVLNELINKDPSMVNAVDVSGIRCSN